MKLLIEYAYGLMYRALCWIGEATDWDVGDE